MFVECLFCSEWYGFFLDTLNLIKNALEYWIWKRTLQRCVKCREATDWIWNGNVCESHSGFYIVLRCQYKSIIKLNQHIAGWKWSDKKAMETHFTVEGWEKDKSMRTLWSKSKRDSEWVRVRKRGYKKFIRHFFSQFYRVRIRSLYISCRKFYDWIDRESLLWKRNFVTDLLTMLMGEFSRCLACWQSFR